MSIQQRKLQNSNAKIDVTGKVHPRQSSSRPSAVQTSRWVAVGDRHVRDLLLSTLLLGTPWTMNGEITQNPNSGEARHATRQGSRLKLVEKLMEKTSSDWTMKM